MGVEACDRLLLLGTGHLGKRHADLTFDVGDHAIERVVETESGFDLAGIDAKLHRGRTVHETGSNQIANRRDDSIQITDRRGCEWPHVGFETGATCNLDTGEHMRPGVVEHERLDDELDTHGFVHPKKGRTRQRAQRVLYARRVSSDLRIDIDRLRARLADLAAIGEIKGTEGCARLALTDQDREGRDLVVTWMRDLGLDVTIDAIGNAVGIMAGQMAGPPVMTGSHIDTVRTGGRYDGNLGVLAGLEVIESIQAAGITPERALAVAFFTNEEGARFPPDMLGSLAYVGGIGIEEALAIIGIDGATVGDELARIGYDGSTPLPGLVPHAFVELHIEQGPVLEVEDITIGAVDGVQGISWTDVTVTGQSNHAGTTPMSMRKDPGFVAAACATFVRDLCEELGGTQVGTVGRVEFKPNLVNVVPATTNFTVDLRNTDEAVLQHAERRFHDFLQKTADAEACTYVTKTLARFEPVDFDRKMVSLIAETASGLGYSVKTMPSGAGHDAQMLARVCPTAMIFTPSQDGLSHNPAEYTSPGDLEAGANVLLQAMLQLAES